MKQAKNIWLSVLGFVLIGGGIYLIKTVPDPQGIMRALPFLLVGFGCGIFGHGLGELLAKKAAESDPEMARQLEIAQTDERSVMIGNMAKAKGYDDLCVRRADGGVCRDGRFVDGHYPDGDRVFVRSRVCHLLPDEIR